MTTPTPSGSPQDLPELPPLPAPAITSLQTDSVMRVTTVRSFSHDQMDEYGMCCVLADRAARQQAVPAGYWMAPMEPDEALCEAIADVKRRRLLRAIESDDHDELRPRGMVPACAEEFRAGRDSWLSRHPAPPAQPAQAVESETAQNPSTPSPAKPE